MTKVKRYKISLDLGDYNVYIPIKNQEKLRFRNKLLELLRYNSISIKGKNFIEYSLAKKSIDTVLEIV